MNARRRAPRVRRVALLNRGFDAADVVSPRPPLARRRPPIRALIIDDNPDDVAVFRRGVRGLGLRLEIASDGRSGLERALREPFDLIVLDYRLGDMLGTEVLARLREAGRKVPIVFHSGRVSNELMERTLSLGAQGVLAKDDPQYLDRMRSRIRLLIRRMELSQGGAPA